MKQAILLSALAFAGCATAPPSQKVLFLCPYGGAKSVIAASYFNRLAEEQGLPYRAEAAAAETPYDAVPAPVAALLAGEGIDVSGFQPRRVEAGDVRGAARVVTIDCDPATLDLSGARSEAWNDVPKVSVDLEGSAAAIRRHVERLAGHLADTGGRHPSLR
jgi:protein-tyrosine-phosphatase